MGYPISRGNTAKPLTFLMVLASNHITGATGKTPTVTISKNGGAFASPSGSVSEIGNGLYSLAANSTDANTLGPLLLHATASACDPRDDTFDVVNYNPENVHPYSPPTTATFGTITARDLITGAFADIGSMAEGEPLSAAMGQDGLRRLNGMISLWALQPGTMLADTREVFDLVANQASYTLGPNGDFNTVRPVYLLGAGLLLNEVSPAVEIPLGILSQAAYQAIPIKDQTSTQPVYVYYTATQPLATVALWPIPTTSTNSLVIYSQQATAGFADLTTQYTLAPGYSEAIEYNLAKRLATPYGRALPQDIREFAAQSLAWVKTANTTLVDAVLDPALTAGSRGIYNILSDM